LWLVGVSDPEVCDLVQAGQKLLEGCDEKTVVGTGADAGNGGVEQSYDAARAAMLGAAALAATSHAGLAACGFMLRWHYEHTTACKIAKHFHDLAMHEEGQNEKKDATLTRLSSIEAILADGGESPAYSDDDLSRGDDEDEYARMGDNYAREEMRDMQLS
jgi:hypothetical protein